MTKPDDCRSFCHRRFTPLHLLCTRPPILGHHLAQVHRQEAPWQFHTLKLLPQTPNDAAPLGVRGEAASRTTADAVFAVEKHVQGVGSVAARRHRDADGIVEVRGGSAVGGRTGGFVQFKGDLGQVVELGNGGARELRVQTPFEDAIE